MPERPDESSYFLTDTDDERYRVIEGDYGKIIRPEDIDQYIIEYTIEAIDIFEEVVDIFEDIKMVFLEDLEVMGRYFEGVIDSPVIMLSEVRINKAEKKYNVGLFTTVATTVYHELGHAIYRYDFWAFDNHHLGCMDNEDFAEQFEYSFHELTTIPEQVEKLIKTIE